MDNASAARSAGRVGIAVRADAMAPPIASGDEVTRRCSPPVGRLQHGFDRHLLRQVIERLGIADAVRAKATIYGSGGGDGHVARAGNRGRARHRSADGDQLYVGKGETGRAAAARYQNFTSYVAAVMTAARRRRRRADSSASGQPLSSRLSPRRASAGFALTTIRSRWRCRALLRRELDPTLSSSEFTVPVISATVLDHAVAGASASRPNPLCERMAPA
jgi:hypothetical protein